MESTSYLSKLKISGASLLVNLSKLVKYIECKLAIARSDIKREMTPNQRSRFIGWFGAHKTIAQSVDSIKRSP